MRVKYILQDLSEDRLDGCFSVIRALTAQANQLASKHMLEIKFMDDEMCIVHEGGRCTWPLMANVRLVWGTGETGATCWFRIWVVTPEDVQAETTASRERECRRHVTLDEASQWIVDGLIARFNPSG